MVYSVRNRSKFYKRVLLDVWGHHLLYLKISKLINYIKYIKEQRRIRKLYYRRSFVYSFRKILRFRRKKRLKWYYINPRYFYNFYLIIRRRTFRNYFNLAKRMSGVFRQNYFNFLEGRLFMLVYRANFITNIFKLKYIIDRGIFLVNGEIQYYSNLIVNHGELVQVHYKWLNLVKKDFLLRCYNGNVIKSRSPGRYIFVNYKFMFIFFIRIPKKRELYFPIRFDLYLGGDIYFL